MPSASTPPVDRRILRALAHPVRQRILLAGFSDTAASISAAELSREWAMPVPNVAYHVRTLHRLGALRLVARVAKRGAIEHRFAVRTDELPQLRELLYRPTRSEPTTVADVGIALRRLRERQGANPVHIGRAVGLDADEILAIEEGRGNPPLRTLIDLVECLDASLADLVQRHAAAPRPRTSPHFP